MKVLKFEPNTFRHKNPDGEGKPGQGSGSGSEGGSGGIDPNS